MERYSHNQSIIQLQKIIDERTQARQEGLAGYISSLDRVSQQADLRVLSMSELVERESKKTRQEKQRMRAWELELTSKVKQLRDENTRLLHRVAVLEKRDNEMGKRHQVLLGSLQNSRFKLSQYQHEQTVLHQKLKQLNSSEAALVELRQQVGEWEVSHEAFMQFTLDGILKEKDRLVGALNRKCQQYEAELKEVGKNTT